MSSSCKSFIMHHSAGSRQAFREIKFSDKKFEEERRRGRERERERERDERLKTKSEKSTRLTYTGFLCRILL
jgi:hypothetical protein